MSDSPVPPADPSLPADDTLSADDTLPDGPTPDQRGGDEPWTVRISAKVLVLVGAVVAAVLVAVVVVAVVVNRGPGSPTEVVNDFIAAAEAGDLERFESHLCGELRQEWRQLPTEVQLRSLDDMTQSILTMNLKTVGEEIHPGGDQAVVMITYTDDAGETVEDSFSLNREDGQWKVCG